MKKFTEAYTKARNVLTTQIFASGDPDWNAFLKTEASVSGLLARDGPDVKHANAPSKVRSKISDSARGGFAAFFLGGGVDDVIWDAAGAAKAGSQAERAATIKFVQHFYRIDKRGAQDVWVYNAPRKYKGWVFDEVKGSDSACKKKLGFQKEIFSKKEMEYMSSALKIALAACQKANAKINSEDDTTKQKIKDWFCDDHSSDAQYQKALTALKAGMPKIVSLCNSNKLVFADYPDWRDTRKKYFGAAFRGGEGGGFPVIYLEGAFTRLTGNSGKMWLCAETIIHEASHHEISTKDHFYDSDGLKPKAGSFPVAKAINNADSWGYFVIDIDGKLSKADKERVLKAPR